MHHAVLRAYAVLAAVSSCCPPVQGRLPTRYSPVRHSVNKNPSENFNSFTSFDLYVLGTPPAFILSQDQTLMLKCLYPGSKLSLANFKPFYCFVRFCSECSHSWSKPKTIFIRIFRVLHTVQFSRNFVSLSLSFSAATHSFYHTVSGLSRTF